MNGHGTRMLTDNHSMFLIGMCTAAHAHAQEGAEKYVPDMTPTLYGSSSLPPQQQCTTQ
jgi:hypothetical protein